MSKLSTELSEYGFERVGAIESDSEGNFKSMSNLSEYNRDPEHNNIRKNETPSVYVWALEEKKTPITAFYVGKAGKGFFPERFNGHRNGSMQGKGGSISGRNRWKLLKLIIGPEAEHSNYTIGVYERMSNQVDKSVLQALGLGSLATAEFIKEMKGIRMNSSEEEIFIEYFKQFGINGELVGNNINDLNYAKDKVQEFLRKT